MYRVAADRANGRVLMERSRKTRNNAQNLSLEPALLSRFFAIYNAVRPLNDFDAEGFNIRANPKAHEALTLLFPD